MGFETVGLVQLSHTDARELGISLIERWTRVLFQSGMIKSHACVYMEPSDLNKMLLVKSVVKDKRQM